MPFHEDILFYAAFAIPIAAFTFVFVCAEQVGFGRLAKWGFLFALVGMALFSVTAFVLAENPFANVTSFEDIERQFKFVDRVLLLGDLALWKSGAGGLMIFSGTTAQTWRHRRVLFPFLYGRKE